MKEKQKLNRKNLIKCIFFSIIYGIIWNYLFIITFIYSPLFILVIGILGVIGLFKIFNLFPLYTKSEIKLKNKN